MKSIAPPDPRLELWLRRSVWLGCALLLLIPAARGHSALLGWLPLWLLGMPLTAWWALHRFRLPHRPAHTAAVSLHRRRRRGPQALRRRPSFVTTRHTQAA
ncbi:MAG: hypothetical protein M3R16_08635 [Pseudomonadota bacterium]|nr:hypothetical protein [Pseudomonadota bacterium]